ncbi:unnamed protein product, partial [Ectocarpus sp. 12 AP-2014]
MKRLLLVTAAFSVLATSFSAPASAQNFDIKQLCNPALGVKCPDAFKGTAKRVPAKRNPPKVVVQQPKKKVFVPQVIVTQPPKKTTRPVHVVPHKQVTPQVKVPNVRIVTPKDKAPTIRVPNVKVAPGIRVPDVQIAVPPKVRQPAVKVTPNGRVVVKPGAVNIDDLRKQLAGELVGRNGGTIKVGPRPGKVVRIPTGNIDLGSSQRQADIVALRDVAKVAAAVGLAAGAVKVLDRTLTDQEIRRSSQDFGAVLGQVGIKTGT